MLRHARYLHLLFAGLFSFLSVTVLDAHHGRDFLLARTAELPHPGQVFLIPRQDIIHDDRGTGVEFEPAVIGGLSDRVAIEAHSHVERQPKAAWQYESTAAAIHFALTSPERAWAAGASLEYERSHVADTNDRVEGRFIVSRSTDAMKLAFNVFAGRGGLSPDDPGATAVRWSYGLGVRRRLARKLDVGAEAEGNLRESSRHEVLVGFYTEPTERITLNVGVGTGLGRQAPDLTVRTALVLRLR